MECTKGRVLSPFIWLLTADPLLNKLEQLRNINIGFADDFVIAVQGKQYSVIFESKKVENFPAKVDAVLFKKRNKISLHKPKTLWSRYQCNK